MLALLATLLLLPAQLDRPMWTAHVLAKAPGQSSTLASGAGAQSIATCGNAPGTNFPDECRALLLGTQGYMDVTPAGFAGAMINDSSAWQHVGCAKSLGACLPNAWMWTDGGQSIDLQPPGYSESEALGVGIGQQVGYVYPGGWCAECGLFMQRHAAKWSGSADSVELLHSTMSSSTMATGTDGVQQVGHGAVGGGGYLHALLWKGAGWTAVDLHPLGYLFSQACSVDKGQQAGNVWGAPTGGWTHAALWQGTKASFVDLNPPGYAQSTTCCVRDGLQVGSGRPSGATWMYRALAWQGSADSAIDLASLLPGEFKTWNSSAEDIDAHGNIVGFVEVAGIYNPVVWLRTDPIVVGGPLALGSKPLK